MDKIIVDYPNLVTLKMLCITVITICTSYIYYYSINRINMLHQAFKLRFYCFNDVLLQCDGVLISEQHYTKY